METIKGNATIKVEYTITLTLTKGEAQALDAIAGYGTDEFLNVFYPKMGKAYLEPHEVEMRNLFVKIRDRLPVEITKINNAEKAINEAIKSLK